MRRLSDGCDLGADGSAQHRLHSADLLRRPGCSYPRVDLHVGKPASDPGRVAAHLVPRSAEPLVALSHAWRHHLTGRFNVTHVETIASRPRFGRLAFLRMYSPRWSPRVGRVARAADGADTLHACRLRCRPIVCRLRHSRCRQSADRVNASVRRSYGQLGRLRLANPIMVASGTFGYAREMAGLVDLAGLGGILPKTITPQPRGRQPAVADGRNRRRHAQFDRAGQRRHRGLHRAAVALPGRARRADHRQHRRPRSRASSSRMAARLDGAAGHRRPGTEHLLPERQRRRRFRHRSGHVRRSWSRRARGLPLPILAKLTPNVTDIADDRPGGGRAAAPTPSR